MRFVVCKFCTIQYNRETVNECPLCFGGKDIKGALKILNGGKKYEKKGYKKKKKEKDEGRLYDDFL